LLIHLQFVLHERPDVLQQMVARFLTDCLVIPFVSPVTGVCIVAVLVYVSLCICTGSARFEKEYPLQITEALLSEPELFLLL
ncbi:hypothetical protein, partial [Escherichia coli]|uniref:hypothetical protein n=1 Tax=Escherichia coli TaxID=562 RepID=UPI001BC83202